MPSRRRFLSLCGLVVTSTVCGCVGSRADPKPVDVLLRNEDRQTEWQLTVTVETDTGENVFHTEETIPPNDGEDLGEVLIEDAFTGTSGDHFTVQALLNGEQAGPFDYEITCSEDNRFTLDIEDRPFNSDDGDVVEYVDRWCAE